MAPAYMRGAAIAAGVACNGAFTVFDPGPRDVTVSDNGADICNGACSDIEGNFSTSPRNAGTGVDSEILGREATCFPPPTIHTTHKFYSILT
jgi:hypothetical protein